MATESGHLTRLLPNLQSQDREKLHNALAATGAKVGATATSKIGFYGKTPIARATVTAPTVIASTTTNEAAIIAINTALVNLGLYTTT